MVKTPEDYGLSWGRRIEALCQCTGYFNYQYGLVELAITALLAKALDYEEDYEKFDLLVKGLDASGKIERLLSAEPYMPIGENLRLLLGDFKDKDVKLRNIMAHSWPVIDEDLSKVQFATLGRMINTTPSPVRGRPRNLTPPTYTVKFIYERVAWLHNLWIELLQIGRIARKDLSGFEVDPVRLTLPAEPQRSPKPNPHAIRDRRARKAHRKTLR